MIDVSMLLAAAFMLLLVAPLGLEYLGLTRWSNAAPVVIGLGIVGLAALQFEAPTSEGGSAWASAEPAPIQRPRLAEVDWAPTTRLRPSVDEPQSGAAATLSVATLSASTLSASTLSVSKPLSVVAATEMTIAAAVPLPPVKGADVPVRIEAAVPQPVVSASATSAPAPARAPEPARAMLLPDAPAAVSAPLTALPPSLALAGNIQTGTLSVPVAQSPIKAAAVLAAAHAGPQPMLRPVPADAAANPVLAALKTRLAQGWATKTFQIEAMKIRDAVQDQIGDYYRISLYEDVKGLPVRITFKNGQYALNEANKILAKKSLESLVDGLLTPLQIGKIEHQMYVGGYASNKQFALLRVVAPQDADLQRVQYIPDKGEGVRFGGPLAIQTVSGTYNNAELPVLRGAYISRFIGRSGVLAKAAEPQVLAGDIKEAVDPDSKSFDLILLVKW
jgi:hypothetical protein